MVAQFPATKSLLTLMQVSKGESLPNAGGNRRSLIVTRHGKHLRIALRALDKSGAGFWAAPFQWMLELSGAPIFPKRFRGTASSQMPSSLGINFHVVVHDHAVKNIEGHSAGLA